MKKTKTVPKKNFGYYELREGKKSRFIIVTILGKKMMADSTDEKFLIELPSGELKEVWDCQLYKEEY